MIVIKNQFALVKSITTSNVSSISFFLKLKIFRTSKRIQTNIYAEKSITLKPKQKKNVKIKHKFLTSRNYIFESIRKTDFNPSFCLLKINAIVSNDCEAIPMTNFEKAETKIYANQLLKRFRLFEIPDSIFTMDFGYENVFFGKPVPENEKKISNPFVIDTSEKNPIITSNVNEH